MDDIWGTPISGNLRIALWKFEEKREKYFSAENPLKIFCQQLQILAISKQRLLF